MNVLVVDSSAWIEFLRGKPSQAIDLALQEGRVYLSPIVMAELLSGFKTESKRSAFKEFLRELPPCASDIEHWLKVGEMRAKLLAAGLSVSIPDAHIAQCTLDLGGYLVTFDKIFSKIATQIGLKLTSF